MARLERNARKPGSWESAPSNGNARLIPLSIKPVTRVKKNDLILVVNINHKNSLSEPVYKQRIEDDNERFTTKSMGLKKKVGRLGKIMTVV